MTKQSKSTDRGSGTCPCLLLCTGSMQPYPTTSSVVLTVDRGRVLRIEDMGPAADQPAAPFVAGS